MAKNCFVERISRSKSQARSRLAAKCTKHKSDFEPVKFITCRHDLQMKQPANFDMFYGLRNSQI
ncbi:hypothetical protein ETS21_23015 [Vibrio parahaemolyticus]|nr:hypothetical protein [Vibrio parahaemolyticus]